eukprot:TRINITY_DN65304_c0_g1_i2.p1 TRINITY_DN65304_c0_g1~~TRINITY_DN65304_c0_g1_i2.p1  ORF type:complete len:106 (+),score=15.80 TRINITY_DN65304_c0_g1_i2:1-318(+)
MCVCTFITYPICAAFDVVINQMGLQRRIYFNYPCVVIVLLNSCINVVFYMFVTRFRIVSALKRRMCMLMLLPSVSDISITESDDSENIVESKKRYESSSGKSVHQ